MDTQDQKSNHAFAAGSDEPAVGDGLGRLLVTFLIAAVLVFAGCIFIRDMLTAWVAMISAGVCCAASVAGYFLSIFPKGDHFRLVRLYQAMAVRLVIPVLFLFLCRSLFREYFDLGMVYFVFLFYLVGVATEVSVQVKRLSAVQSSIHQGSRKAAAGGKTQAG